AKKTEFSADSVDSSVDSANAQSTAFKMPPQPPQPPHYPPPHPHGPFEQALRHLLLLGLVFWGRQTNFAGRDYTSGVHDGVVIVSTSVLSVARNAWKLEDNPDIQSLPIDELNIGNTADVLSRPQSLQRALYLYWSLVAAQRGGLSLVGNGLL